jgi:hypothetical protein
MTEPAKKARTSRLLPFLLLERYPSPSLLPGHEQVGEEQGDDRNISDKHERDKH